MDKTPASALIRVDILDREGNRREVFAGFGKTLRETLLEAGLGPYSKANRLLNCKGLGICGTCSVQVKEGESFWARRSCQIRCFHDLEIHLE